MPETPETDQPPACIRYAQTVLEQLRAEDPALADSLKSILPGYALRQEKDGQSVTAESLLEDARKGPDWFKVQKPAKTKITKTPIEVYHDVLASFPIPLNSQFIDACKQSDLEAIRTMHQNGADITAQDNNALIEAAAKGHLDVVQYLHQNGADITAQKNRALIYAAQNGYPDVVRYLHQHGADITAQDNMALMWAAQCGHLEIIQYLHQHGADITARDNTALMWAATNGPVGFFQYLHENGADITAQGKYALIYAAKNGHLDIVQYLCQHSPNFRAVYYPALVQAVCEDRMDVAQYLHQRGTDMSTLYPGQLEKFTAYELRQARWQKAVRCDPPRGLYKQNPRLFKKAAYDFLLPLLAHEGYKDVSGHVMAFEAAGLLQTPDRAMQYLKAWGQPGKQPLHDVIHMIHLPQDDCTFSIKDWGDAVLKCGPSMARLVKFADRIPAPARSSDGKTWSYVATRALCAEFAYEKAAMNEPLAGMCFEHDLDEDAFERALKIVETGNATQKAVPDIMIAGERFGMEGGKFYRLAADDMRGLFLGEMTNCCQSIGGHGHECAKYGYKSENGGFYVVENTKGKIVSQTFAWRTEKGGMCFDTLETLGDNVTGEQWAKILQEIAAELTQRQDHDIARLTVGLGGRTPGSLGAIFEKARKPAKPLDYKGYSEAQEQVVIWERPAAHTQS